MKIEEHSKVEIPIADYMELMASHVALNEKAVMVLCLSGGYGARDTQYYAVPEQEVLIKQSAEIEELQLIVAKLRTQLAEHRHIVRKPFWKFW